MLRAQQRARIVSAWWRKHRSGGEDVFEQELMRTLDRLAMMSPSGPIGTVEYTRHGRTVWRVLMPKTKQHLTYSINVAKETVLVRMIWGALRGRRPGR